MRVEAGSSPLKPGAGGADPRPMAARLHLLRVMAALAVAALRGAR